MAISPTLTKCSIPLMEVVDRASVGLVESGAIFVETACVNVPDIFALLLLATPYS
jgi:hypothetical protein